jgi:signal transduction histidine kinase
MTDLMRWLESRQADLVNSLERRIAECPGARRMTHSQVSAIVLMFPDALEQGPSVLDTVMQEWERESDPTDPPSGTWVNTVKAIREEIWASVISEFSPAKALVHLRAIENLFAHTVATAAALDHQSELQELRGELQRAHERFLQLENSKSDFISIAAHELKTPLTLIEGYANMMMMEIPEEQQTQVGIMLGGIANGTYRLRAIIESMIDISMIDTSVLEISFQPVYLRNLTKVAVEELADVLRIRQISMQVAEFPDDGAPTYGDPERLHQAIFNVIGNAIKYTPDGRHIRIQPVFHPSNIPDDGRLRGHLDIQVIDSGIGIAAENQDRIFDKFSGLGSVALHSTGKYKFKGGGPGLGLAISRGIIEAHGGKIWVESDGYDEDKCPGSTFHIYLPLLDAPPGQEATSDMLR